MKNLENYGVQELNTKEIQRIDGGKNLIEYIVYGIGYAWHVYSANISYGSAGYAPGQ